MKVTLSSLVEARTYDLLNRNKDLEELFYVGRKVGFDGIDYLGTIPDAFFTPKKAQELSIKYELPILVMHAPLHLLLMTPQFLIRPVLKTIRHFPKLKVFNFHLSGFLHPLDTKGKSLQPFISIAKKENAPVSYESNPLLMGLGNYPKETYDPETFGNFCVKHNLPITFDTSHIFDCGYDIVTFFKKFHKQIKLIHLSDAKKGIQHLPLGRGDLPIKQLLMEMKKVKFNQYISFEIGNYDRSVPTEKKIPDVAASLAMVNRYAR